MSSDNDLLSVGKNSIVSATAEFRDKSIETFDVEPSRELIDPSLFSKPHRLATINVFNVERKGLEIIEIKNTNLKGCICLCDFDHAQDVEQAINLAMSQGAIAVLAVKSAKLIAPHETPVFSITQKTMNRLCGEDQIFLMFEMVGGGRSTKNAAAAESEDPLRAPTQNLSEMSSNMPSSDSDGASSPNIEEGPMDIDGTSTGTESAALSGADHGDTRAGPWYFATVSGRLYKQPYSWSTSVQLLDYSKTAIVPTELPLMILPVIVTRNENTHQVERLVQDPKDRVLVYDSEVERDVNRVQNLAAQHGATALFVACKPRFSESIPVFVVDRSVIQKMAGVDLGRIKFEHLGSKPSSSTTAGTNVHDQDLGSPSYDAPSSYAAAAKQKVDAPLNMGTEKKRAAPLGGGAADKKPKGGFLNNIVDWFRGEEPIFVALENRSFSSVIDGYHTMKQNIQDALRRSNPREINNLVHEAANFLDNKVTSLAHIAVAVRLHGRCIFLPFVDEGASGLLGVSILKAVSSFDVRSQEFTFLEVGAGQYRIREIRQTLYTFLVNHAIVVEFADGGVINVILFLIACGLFRRPFDQEHWRALRKSVDPAVFNQRTQELLASATDATLSRVLVLCLQRDFTAFADTLLQSGTSLVSKCQQIVGGVLPLVVEEHLSNGSDVDLVGCWDHCLALFAVVSFREPCRKQVMALFISGARGYAQMSDLMKPVDRQHPDHAMMQEQVMAKLSKDLRGGLDLAAVSSLFQESALAAMLPLQPMEKTTLTFVEQAASTWPSFQDKMRLIALFLELFVGQGCRSYYNHFCRQLNSLIQSEPGEAAAITAFLQLAESDTDLLSAVGAIGGFRVVADAFATPVCAKEILHEPTKLGDLAYNTDDKARLYHFVVKQLGQMMSLQCQTVVDASAFHIKVADSSAGGLAQHMATSVFVEALKKWNPSKWTDVQPRHKQVVDVLFLTLAEECAEHQQALVHFRRRITELVDSLIEKYQNADATREEFHYMLAAAECQLWSAVTSFKQFPDKSAIEEQLAKFDVLEASMNQSLSVLVSDSHVVPMAEVLREYICHDEEIHSFLPDYDFLFQGTPDVHLTRKPFRLMEKDCAFMKEMTTKSHHELFFCAYFATNKSILFRGRVIPKDGQPQNLKMLCSSTNSTVSWLATVFGPKSTFAGVCSAASSLSTLNTSLDQELDALAKCNRLNISFSDVENFRLLLTLCNMSEPMQHFVACLNRFDFEGVRDDSYCGLLEQEMKSFFDREPASLGVGECQSFAGALCRVLFPHVDASQVSSLRVGLLEIKPLFELFSTMARYPDLWKYANEMEWFGEEGLKVFYDQYNNVTNVLLGDSESYEMSLLNAMEPAMRVISALGGIQSSASSLLGLVEHCRGHKDIAAVLEGGIEQNVCQVHSRLSEIKDWFSNGVDDLAAAHSLFNAATSSGHYSIAAVDRGEVGRHCLTLTFEVDSGESAAVRKLQGEQLSRFVQQLSLIQNENTTSAVMQGFADQYQILIRASNNVMAMFSLGYERIQISDFGCRAGSQDTESALRSFKLWLANTRDQTKELLLFWTEELRELHDLVPFVSQRVVPPAILFNKIQRLEPLCEFSQFHSDPIHGTLLALAEDYTEHTNKGSEGWLVAVSRFLRDLKNELGVDQGAQLKGHSQLVLHSYRCGDTEECHSVFKLLHHIYKERAPWSFEVLDGAIDQSEEHMELFLERAQAFPCFCFTVVNVDRLQSCVLERLLSFLSDREITSFGIKLHCIQRGETLRASPWVIERSWDSDALEALPALLPNSSWHSPVFSRLQVITSSMCGSGKTKCVRDHISSTQEEAAVGTVVVHEGTSAGSLIKALNAKFSGGESSHLLHVSFAFLPKRGEKHDRWLREMNYFFFCLIVLRSVFDPTSCNSFALSGQWTILFEIPGGAAALDWLLANLPTVRFFCGVQEPSDQFAIDDEARRVCTYLRALSNGTINRKFESAVKRVVLVLDRSGSMAYGDNESIPFEDAKRNAVSVFDSHVVEGDEFAVVLFDHNVHDQIPLQTVGTDKTHLRHLIQTLPFEEDGGTSMYSALLHVLGTLARDQTAESWVICLTDGESADIQNEARFRQELMASAENVHIITIGINLRPQYQQNLENISRKYGGSAATQGFFVPCQGTTAGMDNAFQVVKSRIPVSQTFERDGAMSDDECRQYMGQYLPSSIEPGDMISQSFWVRFLYRRVKVFDSNESFNYNETHDSLGSSLMEVMLSEVERLLGENLRRDWLDVNHAQLIYDFTHPEAPEFRLICTAPDKLEPELRRKLTSLDLPGFRIPTKQDLDCRGTLDRFLSQAMDIPMEGGRLRCIDECGFILTLDFTMKLLSIHERVACRIPCLMEGETNLLSWHLSAKQNDEFEVDAQPPIGCLGFVGQPCDHDENHYCLDLTVSNQGREWGL